MASKNTPAAVSARKVDAADTAPQRYSENHNQGWPHFDRLGNCLCLKKCCLAGAGCSCRYGCSGQSHTHERVTNGSKNRQPT